MHATKTQNAGMRAALRWKSGLRRARFSRPDAHFPATFCPGTLDLPQKLRGARFKRITPL